MKIATDKMLMVASFIAGIGMYIAYQAGRSEVIKEQKQKERDTWAEAEKG